ncbi:MAG: hypothetical protein H6Q19_2236 [Bacteroidetes bacterium]|nr:hypothetical protein [Bacteroidota bacterium]
MDFISILFQAGVWLSFAGLIFLVISFLTGLRVIKPKKPIRFLHKKLSISAFVLVGIHALIMIYFYLFT